MAATSNQILSEVVESKITSDKLDRDDSILAWCNANWRNFFSEFLSTLTLVLFGCMSCLPIVESDVYGALGFGLVVMFNIQIFGHISGAHMNPVVTLATVIWGSTSVAVGIAYAIIQCIGSIAGYGILVALTSMDLTAQSVCITQPYPGQNAIQTLGVEIGITATLILINCAMWDPVNKDKQESASIKFGLTVVGLSLVGGPLTGASMNPARTLGPALWTNIWTAHWVYWVGPLLGSLLGVYIYKFSFFREPKDYISVKVIT